MSKLYWTIIKTKRAHKQGIWYEYHVSRTKDEVRKGESMSKAIWADSPKAAQWMFEAMEQSRILDMVHVHPVGYATMMADDNIE